MSARDFVKSATTSTSVYNSKAELERILRRYGADQFSTAQDYSKGLVVVQFTIPDTPEKGAKLVPVRFPVETRRVYDRLFGQPTRWLNGKHVHNPDGYQPKQLEQAERVAWRNVILWVDAQLSSAAVGIQTVTEAFIAHAAIGPNGERVVDVLPDYLESRRLLTAGDS